MCYVYGNCRRFTATSIGLHESFCTTLSGSFITASSIMMVCSFYTKKTPPVYENQDIVFHMTLQILDFQVEIDFQ